MSEDDIIAAKVRGVVAHFEYINWLHDVARGTACCDYVLDEWEVELNLGRKDEDVESALQTNEVLFSHWAVTHRTEF